MRREDCDDRQYYGNSGMNHQHHQQQNRDFTPTFTPLNSSILQRKCACGQSRASGGECSACKKKHIQRQRAPANITQSSEAPQSVHDVLSTSGQSLEAGPRRFMESRFNRDFSQVRLHTDTHASATAHSVGAHAFTVGQHVVFAAGRYKPDTMEGAQLLAHELVHTQQQKSVSSLPNKPLSIGQENDSHEREADRMADGALFFKKPNSADSIGGTGHNSEASVQRACGPRAIGSPTGCAPFGGVSTTEISGRADERFMFVVNCDDFRPGEEARLRALAGRVVAKSVVDIHGFASEEGPAVFNEHLACARIRKAESVLLDAGVPANQIRGRYKHGATSGSRPENRSVVIPLTAPPTINVLEAGFIGPPSLTQRRAAATCPINCDARNIGTLNAMGLYHHASRGSIVAAGSPTATGVGTSLHFTATAIDITRGTPCFCDDYDIIQIIDTTHPATGRVNPYVDNGGVATPFYGDVYAAGTGIHTIPDVPNPDAGERIQSTRSIYDTPYRDPGILGGRNLRWEAEACVACVKNGRPDRILGCATYGFARTYNAASASYNPVTGIGPGCLMAPSVSFLNALRTDPTVSAYDFEGR
jgi:hypothetical protein